MEGAGDLTSRRLSHSLTRASMTDNYPHAATDSQWSASRSPGLKDIKSQADCALTSMAMCPPRSQGFGAGARRPHHPQTSWGSSLLITSKNDQAGEVCLRYPGDASLCSMHRAARGLLVCQSAFGFFGHGSDGSGRVIPLNPAPS